MKHQRGFIALISVLIISGILLAITTATSMSGFLSRFNTLDSEIKEHGKALAEACVDTALLHRAQNSSYLGNETILIATDSCFIRPITSSGGNVTIETQGIYRNTYSNIRVIANATALTVISWEELPHF